MKTLCQVYFHTSGDRQCLCPWAVTISGMGISDTLYREDRYRGQTKAWYLGKHTCIALMPITLFRSISVFAPRKLHHRLLRVKKAFQNQLLLDYFVWPISDTGCTEHVLPPGQFFSCQAIHSGLWCEK